MNYSKSELLSLGVKILGDDVAIHKTVCLFNPALIEIGSRVRIDCFAVISAGKDGIQIGNNVHIGAHAAIFGGGGRVILESFSGLSGRVSIYTSSDDYSSGFLTNPTVPSEYRKCTGGPVVLRQHALIGAGSVVMPNVELGIGAAVGALSLVRSNVDEFEIVFGTPARRIGRRNREQLLELEKNYLATLNAKP